QQREIVKFCRVPRPVERCGPICCLYLTLESKRTGKSEPLLRSGRSFMLPVYRAGRQLIKVRAVMIVALAGLLLCAWWGVELARTHGLNEADGAKLAPLPERLAWGGLVGLLGVTFAAGMWLYGRHYASRIEFDPETKQVHLYTVGFFGNKHHVI